MIGVPKDVVNHYCELYKEKKLTRKQILSELRVDYPSVTNTCLYQWIRRKNINIWDNQLEEMSKTKQQLKKKITIKIEPDFNHTRYERMIKSYNKLLSENNRR